MLTKSLVIEWCILWANTPKTTPEYPLKGVRGNEGKVVKREVNSPWPNITQWGSGGKGKALER